MAGLLRAATPLCLTPLLASCVFLLDYDELRGGPSPHAGGASGAPSSDGGAGGEPAGCGSCDDSDPCTIDTCNDRGPTPECQHEATVGLKLDGLDATLEPEASLAFLRGSLVAGGGAFYFSAFQASEDTADVDLYRVTSDGADLEHLQKLSELGIGAGIVSNVGLAVEELALGEVALHGFVGALPKLGDQPRVFHIEARGGKIDSNVAGMSYLPSALAFPQARVIGGTVTGAWIQADGTIAVHDASTVRADTFGSTSLPATSLSLISTNDDKPAVMFTAQDAEGLALGTYVETSGANRGRVSECETRDGGYVSSAVISTQLPGIWLANITRAGDDYLTTGNATLLCLNGSCTAVAEDCSTVEPANGIRDVAGATVRFETDAPGLIYSVVAVPRIVANEDGASVDGTLSLLLSRSYFMGNGKVESTTIPENEEAALMEIARTPTSSDIGFAGPDWPAVAILPTRQALVAWIQPNFAQDGNELRVQRYRMCLPTDSATSDP